MQTGRPVIYRCAECGKLAVRDGGAIVRRCAHDGKPVTAELSATAYGEGKTAA